MTETTTPDPREGRGTRRGTRTAYRGTDPRYAVHPAVRETPTGERDSGRVPRPTDFLEDTHPAGETGGFGQVDPLSPAAVEPAVQAEVTTQFDLADLAPPPPADAVVTGSWELVETSNDTDLESGVDNPVGPAETADLTAAGLWIEQWDPPPDSPVLAQIDNAERAQFGLDPRPVPSIYPAADDQRFIDGDHVRYRARSTAPVRSSVLFTLGSMVLSLSPTLSSRAGFPFLPVAGDDPYLFLSIVVAWIVCGLLLILAEWLTLQSGSGQ